MGRRGDERMVTYDDIAAAHERIKGVAHRTPVLRSTTADALIGARLFFKCENLQRMGAFKFRGAYNALSQLTPDERKPGVLAFSSGNHAQAVALAGRLLGIRTLIVMPENAPRVKLEATRGYGAEIVTYRKDEDRERVAERVARERGMVTIPSFNHPHIVAGHGQAAREPTRAAARGEGGGGGGRGARGPPPPPPLPPPPRAGPRSCYPAARSPRGTS